MEDQRNHGVQVYVHTGILPMALGPLLGSGRLRVSASELKTGELPSGAYFLTSRTGMLETGIHLVQLRH